MAIIKCKECGSEISTTAAACPKCGAKYAQTSGCAKIALIGVILVAFMLVVGMCSRDKPADTSMPQSTSATPQTAATQSPHDDLSLFISKYGPPDQVKSSENESPRPPIVTKQLIYQTENVRAVYVPDAPVGAPPPYEKWKLLGFQDNRTNAVMEPADVASKLAGRIKE
ncbi:zinc ribbon domain-containing protein [Luteimonas sp. WGS1318]|uniref:zinc ribbon domain-containing protein n=1 Tax=Luteimonas sp. WGS1318 TaxID=3366815 RepID=UPI00372D69AC